MKIGDKVSQIFLFSDQRTHIVGKTESPFGCSEPSALMICGLFMIACYMETPKADCENCQYCKAGRIDPGVLSVALCKALGINAEDILPI